MRKGAIPLGLDLLGGVDVTLMIDREKSVATQVEIAPGDAAEVVRRRQDQRQGNAGAEWTGDHRDDDRQKKDAQSAANLISQYKGVFNQAPTADELASNPSALTLNADELNRNVTSDIQGARKAISDRIDALGVTQPRISLQGTDRIRVQVPGEKNPDRLIQTVIRPAQLTFHLVHPDNNTLIDPATGKLHAGASLPLGTAIFPGKLSNTNKTTNQMETRNVEYVLYKQAKVTGADLHNAGVTYNSTEVDPNKAIQVSLEFTREGGEKFKQLTTENANQGRQMAILLDGVVRSAPTINEPITDGRAAIFGAFSNDEATELSQVLKAGALKAPLKIESKRTVGASLGTESIMKGVKALAGGGVLIALFMIVYYGTAGAVAIVTLILNILMVLAIMALSKATLTLSGIGGLLLTIGMAVDGNVLIYERIRRRNQSGTAAAPSHQPRLPSRICRNFRLARDGAGQRAGAAAVHRRLGVRLRTHDDLWPAGQPLHQPDRDAHALPAVGQGWRGGLSLGKLTISRTRNSTSSARARSRSASRCWCCLRR